MIQCVSVENMRQSDAHTIANAVPSLVLMHRAALGVFKAHVWQGRTAIVVGSGNNGGDGFALACILQSNNYDCAVFTVSQKYSSDSAYYAQKAKDAHIPILPFESGCLAGFTTVVDCLLGTGFRGNLRMEYRIAIEEINGSDAFVISVDINSGMNGDTGIAELAVKSNLTVTIGYVKVGLIKQQAAKYVKKLVCADIGIILLREEWIICTPDDPVVPDAYLCPKWLDPNMIYSIEA